MPDPIRVNEAVTVPGAALALAFTRSSGPGGQNVNKVASKVELRVDLSRIEGLREDARRRLDTLTASRRDAQGRLLVTSQRTRDQSRNLEDARDKVRRLLVRALQPPRTRRATAPSAAAREQRLREKKSRAARKRARTRSAREED
jgi:ribosome-associated protein